MTFVTRMVWSIVLAVAKEQREGLLAYFLRVKPI